MNLPWVYTCSPSEIPSHLLPHTIPLGHPSAPAPSIQYRASNLDWRLVSYMILYMFQCHSPKSSHPLPLPQSPKDSLQYFFFLGNPMDGGAWQATIHGVARIRHDCAHVRTHTHTHTCGPYIFKMTLQTVIFLYQIKNGKGEGGESWENGIETCIISCMK